LFVCFLIDGRYNNLDVSVSAALSARKTRFDGVQVTQLPTRGAH